MSIPDAGQGIDVIALQYIKGIQALKYVRSTLGHMVAVLRSVIPVIYFKAAKAVTIPDIPEV